MADKVFLKCSAKASQYGIRIGVKVEDLLAFANQHKTQSGYLNLEVKQRREVGQYGDTHSVTLDTFTPKPKAGTQDEPW